MERKAVSGIMLTLLLIGILTLAFNIQPVRMEPATTIAPDDYPTIQAALRSLSFNPNVVGERDDSDEISIEASRFSSIVLLGSNLGSPSRTSTSEVMSPSSNDVNLYADPYDQDEPTIALNPTNSFNLAAGSHDESTAKPAGTTLWVITYRSLDSGATWSRSYVPRAGPIALFERAGDPVVDFDGFGNAFYSGIAFSRGGENDVSVWVAKSIDGGLTYDTPMMVDEGNGDPRTPFFEFNDKPWIVADKRTTGTGAGYVYVTWTSFVDIDGDGWEDSYHILFSRSIDGGATFSTPTQVSDAENWANQLSQVAVGPNGEVYVSWINWNLPTTRILFDKSTDYGASFGTDIEVQSFVQIPDLQYISRTPPSISMTVDARGGAYDGYIYIAYPVNPPSATDFSDMMLTRSTNGGNAWSTPIRLNDDITSNDQFFPAIVVDPIGRIKVAWYDRRLDPGNRYIDVFLTESSDGGSSFVGNVAVTDTSFDPAYAFIGDHIDIDAGNEWTYPIWTDRRNGNNDVYIDGLPQEHDLAVSLEAPTLLKPGDSTLLNATVYNIGLSNETNVELQLLINGTVVNSTTIPELQVGSSTTINYSWTPTVEATYNVTAYAPPAPDENATANNIMSKIVYVRYVDVALISDGSELEAVTDILDSMGIDYDIYNKNSMYLHTEDLSLLLDYPAVIFYQYERLITSAEHSALESYLSSGGDLLVTGFDCLVGDSLLADLVRSSSYGDNTGEPDLYVVDPSHPIMNGPYGSFPAGYHISGLYHDNDAAEADTARNAVTVAELADGYDKIITTDGLPGKVVYWNGIGPDDWMKNVDCETIFKNTLAWFMIQHEHELTVSLDAPAFLGTGDSSLLNATVYNRGISSETDVELFLLINGTTVNSTTISELLTGASYTINYLWTPTVEATYNVTAYAPPVPDENLTANNVKSVTVLVQVLPDILIVDDNDGSFWVNGTSLLEFESALTTSGYDYWVWNESSMGNPPFDFLTNFNLVIWTCGDYWNEAVDLVDAETLESYLAQGGNILLEGEDIGSDHDGDSFMVNVAHAIYQVDDIGALGLTVTDPTHPVTQGLPTNFTWAADPPYDDGVTPTNGGSEVIRYTDTSWTAVTVFDGTGTTNASVVYYAFPIYSLGQPERDTLIINSVNWLYPNHDIAVINVTPSKTVVGQNYSMSINVTVENQGDYTENFNVTAYANITIIDTLANITLTSGNSTTFTLTWNTTGVAYGNYTISATASTVPSEVDTADNNYSDGTVVVSIPGDINGDKTVDIQDLAALGEAYGSTPTNPNWNPNANINCDGVADVVDLAILGKNYGTTDLYAADKPANAYRTWAFTSALLITVVIVPKFRKSKKKSRSRHPGKSSQTHARA